VGDVDSRKRDRRGLLRDTGPFSGIAIAFLVLGGAFLLAAMWSPSALLWTGQAVPGTSRNGLVIYSYRGQNYSVDDLTASALHQTTVYLDPGNPSDAMLNDPVNRAIDVATVGGPVALAVVLLGFGFRRRWQRGRIVAPAGSEDSFGRGLGQDTIDWVRDRQRWGI